MCSFSTGIPLESPTAFAETFKATTYCETPWNIFCVRICMYVVRCLKKTYTLCEKFRKIVRLSIKDIYLSLCFQWISVIFHCYWKCSHVFGKSKDSQQPTIHLRLKNANFPLTNSSTRRIFTNVNHPVLFQRHQARAWKLKLTQRATHSS